MQKSSTPSTVVGRKELVDFPKLGVFGVPAKVDTGADSSAIWASKVQETNGVLHFVLFDKTSPYYTGTVLTAKKFTVISVKNSFGHSEFRYKITLPVVLAGRAIRIRFTLANREQNSQPILIGRRTLHGKFLVDVAAGNSSDVPHRMLLMSGRITDSVKSFVQGVTKAAENLAITHTTYDDVQFVIGPEGTRITLLSTGEDIASFDIVHFKTVRKLDVAAAMASYLRSRGVKITDEFRSNFPDSSKLFQYTVLSDNAVAVPESVFVMPSQLQASYQRFVDTLGLPFVLKGIHASKGDHNYLVRGQAQYEQVCNQVIDDGVLVIGQRFIANDGDYRVLVLGRRINLIIHRLRQSEKTHLNNTSQGGTAQLIDLSELPSAVQIASIHAARVLGIGVAGVDMVREIGTDMWYCFEVNDGPQLASGAFVREKQQAFAKYIETELGK